MTAMCFCTASQIINYLSYVPLNFDDIYALICVTHAISILDNYLDKHSKTTSQ